MGRYLPVLLGVVLIVGLTIAQIRMTDRLSGSNVSAEQRAELLKKVPLRVGDWQGKDKIVDENVRKTAGAVGAVSRDYENVRTGEKVELWLIVGHSRQISFHTPDACYPASGFSARGKENAQYETAFPGQPPTPFLTNTFHKEDEISGQQLIRVFWTWYDAESKEHNGKVVWEAPMNARWHFGNTRSLYKMYFTSRMHDAMETTDQSACLRFAREFLPVVNEALAEVSGAETAAEGTVASAESTPAGTPDTTTPADGAPASDSPVAEAAAESATTEPAGTPEAVAPPAGDQDLFAPPPEPTAQPK
jgi:hypothetical protein